MADPPSDSFAPDRDGFVGHDLRLHSQAICRRRIDRHAKIRRIAAVRSHLADHHRCMSSRKGIRLHNHGGPRLAIVPGSRNCDHVAAPHPRSNSDTASIHPNAPSSRAGFKPATSLATRRRIALDRASGTTRRNSRKPRARHRSRIAFIRSAAAIVFPAVVTRDSVTRYADGSNDVRFLSEPTPAKPKNTNTARFSRTISCFCTRCATFDLKPRTRCMTPA